MARKRIPLTREQLLSRMPHRIFTPKLARTTLTMVQLCHMQNLDAIWSGQATLTLMWEWAEGVLTWSYVAEKMGQLQDEMNEQLEVVARTVERFHRTGRVGFSGPDYQTAKAKYVESILSGLDWNVVGARLSAAGY